MSVDPEALYFQIGRLVAEMPEMAGVSPLTSEIREWLARMDMLIEAQGDMRDTASFRLQSDFLATSQFNDSYAEQIALLATRALIRAEMAAPASAKGGFIPTGGAFSAISAVSKVLQSATASVLMVDPYADANLLAEYAVLTPDKVEVRLLTGDKSHKPGLKPAAEAWVKQHGPSRPLEVRLAPASTLHDRLIVVDGREAFTIGQSFNALGTRSPTAIVRIGDADTARMKMDAYNSIWSAATPLS